MAERRRRPKPDYDEDDERRRREGDIEPGETVRVHEAYLAERRGSGPPPDPEAYRRAFEQFQNPLAAPRVRPALATPTEPGPPNEPNEDEPPAAQSTG